MVAISPDLMLPIDLVMCLSHPFDRDVGGDAFREVEPVIRCQEGSGTGSFPLVGVTEALAHGFAQKRRFAGTHPDDRVGTGDIGELELVDADPGFISLLGSGIIKRRHVFGSADFFKIGVFISDGQLAELFLSSLGG